MNMYNHIKQLSPTNRESSTASAGMKNYQKICPYYEITGNRIILATFLLLSKWNVDVCT